MKRSMMLMVLGGLMVLGMACSQDSGSPVAPPTPVVQGTSSQTGAPGVGQVGVVDRFDEVVTSDD